MSGLGIDSNLGYSLIDIAGSTWSTLAAMQGSITARLKRLPKFDPSSQLSCVLQISSRIRGVFFGATGRGFDQPVYLRSRDIIRTEFQARSTSLGLSGRKQPCKSIL